MSSSILYVSSADAIGYRLCEQLVGRKTNSIAGGGAGLIALCDDGCYNVSDGTLFYAGETVEGAVGIDTFALTTSDGKLYTWGIGPTGELGLGPAYQSVSLPVLNRYNASFIKVSSGEYHTIASDSIGGMYGWGQNFDKQLGLYTKVHDDIKAIKSNAVVEEVLFTPRRIPFSVTNKIVKVACGARFTVVVTDKGDVFSWGAGECGQLGTGTCTNRSLPMKVEFPDNKSTNNSISDVSCGDGHVICITTDGIPYSWGMNKRGQLGTGDSKTNNKPIQIMRDCSTSSESIRFDRIFASGNCTAGINDGKLYTWGSGSYYKLMHGDEQHQNRPKVVAGLLGSPVYLFTFSKLLSCAVVLTKAMSIYPTTGPQKSMTQLQINGCGYWNSSNIIVKFTSSGASSFIPPRSCTGRLQSAGIIVCKPPKLNDLGEFDVSLSLDGQDFVDNTMKILIYKDFSIYDIKPKLVNMAESSSFQLRFSVKDLPKVDYDREYDVKLLVSISADGRNSTREVIVKGRIHEHVSSTDGELITDTTLNNTDTSDECVSVDHEVVCHVDIKVLNPASKNNSALLNIRVCLSINEQDYCDLSPESESITCHAFTAVAPHPCCYPYSVTPIDKEIKISGASFIPTNMLPAGTHIEAVFQLTDDSGSKREITTAVTCESADELFVRPPSIVELIKGRILPSKEKKKPVNTSKQNNTLKLNPEYPSSLYFIASLHFQMVSTPVTSTTTAANARRASIMDKKGGTTSTAPGSPIKKSSIASLLGTSTLNIILYQPTGITITPSLIRLGKKTKISVKGAPRGGIFFKSKDAKIHFSRPDLNMSTMVSDIEFVKLEGSSSSSSSSSGTNKGQDEYEVVIKCPTSFPYTVTTASNSTSGTSDIGDSLGGTRSGEDAGDDITSGLALDSSAIEAVTNIDETVEAAAAGEAETKYVTDYVMMSLILDGVTVVSDGIPDGYAKLTLYTAINIVSVTVPKGGALALSTVDVVVSGIDNISECTAIIRIRGANQMYVDIPAVFTLESSSMSFTVPDASETSTLEAEMKGKDKMYYLDISIDGGRSYDKADVPQLQLK